MTFVVNSFPFGSLLTSAKMTSMQDNDLWLRDFARSDRNVLVAPQGNLITANNATVTYNFPCRVPIDVSTVGVIVTGSGNNTNVEGSLYLDCGSGQVLVGSRWTSGAATFGPTYVPVADAGSVYAGNWQLQLIEGGAYEASFGHLCIYIPNSGGA